MATLKDSEDNWFKTLKERSDNWNKSHPIIQTAYSVEEYTPAILVPNEYDDNWTDDKSKVVSPWFDTEEEAEDWITKYNPAEGSIFRITKKYLREVPASKQWYNY